jgi:hypothetical protein
MDPGIHVEQAVTAHPLVTLYGDIAGGSYPPADGRTDIMRRPPGALAAVLAFTAHHVVATNLDPAWVRDWCPPGDLLAPVSPRFLAALEERLGCAPGPLDLVLCASGQDGELETPLVRLDPDHPHPRVQRALHVRSDVQIFGMPGGEAVLTIGRGLAGRWEAGFEIAPEHRNRGLGRALVIAARRLFEPHETLFMQVAAGNVASLRAVLAGGFAPIGAEILFGVILPIDDRASSYVQQYPAEIETAIADSDSYDLERLKRMIPHIEVFESPREAEKR